MPEFHEIIGSPYLEPATPLIRSVLECSSGRASASHSLKLGAHKFLDTLAAQGALIPASEDSIKLLALTLTHHLRSPKNPLAWLNIAIALRLMARTSLQDPAEKNFKRLSLARDACKKSLSEDSSAIRSWTELGIIWHLLKQPENSLAAFDEGSKIRPDDVSLHLWRALALEILGKKKEALEVIETARRYYYEQDRPGDLGDLFELNDANAILRIAVSNALTSIEIGSEKH